MILKMSRFRKKKFYKVLTSSWWCKRAANNEIRYLREKLRKNFLAHSKLKSVPEILDKGPYYQIQKESE